MLANLQTQVKSQYAITPSYFLWGVPIGISLVGHVVTKYVKPLAAPFRLWNQIGLPVVYFWTLLETGKKLKTRYDPSIEGNNYATKDDTKKFVKSLMFNNIALPIVTACWYGILALPLAYCDLNNTTHVSRISFAGSAFTVGMSIAGFLSFWQGLFFNWRLWVSGADNWDSFSTSIFAFGTILPVAVVGLSIVMRYAGDAAQGLMTRLQEAGKPKDEQQRERR